MKINIVDNFLPQRDLDALREVLYSSQFPWYFSDGAVYKDLNNNITDYQFTHTFFSKFNITSAFFNVLDPLLQKIDPSALLRVKANLNTRTDKIIVRDMHRDVLDFKGTSAVFYINTNDGKTIFEDGTVVYSVANRLLTFDSTTLHAGTTCTDQKTRCVINLNYYTKYNYDAFC